ncbi:hypothetical protein HYR69_08330, partial [Candidatus Sumerlaeota bacterium]|nr:hypothetical protein [Candidatus Sumerlaeota bacterium]
MSNLSLENIQFVPSIHQRMAFADEVRRGVESSRPDCIAVELPPSLKSRIARGVMRLPQISTVCWPNAEGSGRMFYIPIDPCDSMIEAVRLGIEREIEIEFIDGGYAPDRGHPESTDIFSLPDDAMVAKTGLESYVRIALPFLARIPAGNLKGFRPIRIEDEREAFMAAR